MNKGSSHPSLHSNPCKIIFWKMNKKGLFSHFLSISNDKCAYFWPLTITTWKLLKRDKSFYGTGELYRNLCSCWDSCVLRGKHVEEFVWCWWVTCWICANVLTGNRLSVPKPPVSRDHLLLQNLLLLRLRFQLQLRLHPISMRSLGVAKCESTSKNVFFIDRRSQWSCICQMVSRFLYILSCEKKKIFIHFELVMSSRLIFNRREGIFNRWRFSLVQGFSLVHTMLNLTLNVILSLVPLFFE